LIILFALSIGACSYSTDFVVVNESGQTIEVRYKIKRFPNEPSTLTARPAKIASSEITTRDIRAWRNLTPDEYQVNQETRTITVKVLPHEALWVTSMFHYFGDDDPHDVASWPVDEITLTGAEGGMTFSGDKSRKASGDGFVKSRGRVSQPLCGCIFADKMASMRFKAYLIAFIAVFILLIAANYYSYLHVWGWSCDDCIIRFGFPFDVWEEGGFVSVKRVLWPGVIADLSIAIWIGILIGWASKKLLSVRYARPSGGAA